MCSRFATAAELDKIHQVIGTMTAWRLLRNRYRYCEIPVGVTPALAELEARARARLQPELGDEVNSFLLDYGDGHYIEDHVDSNSLQRLNLLVVASQPPGGVFSCQGQPVPLQPGDAVVFEPATTSHGVSPVIGRRVIWSYGVVKHAPKRKMFLPLAAKVAVE